MRMLKMRNMPQPSRARMRQRIDKPKLTPAHCDKNIIFLNAQEHLRKHTEKPKFTHINHESFLNVRGRHAQTHCTTSIATSKT